MTGVRLVRELDDWTPVLDLLQREFAYMDGRIDPPSSLNRWSTDKMQAEAALGCAILAYRDNCLIGCAFTKPQGNALYVGKIAVDQDHRGTGLLRMMMSVANRLALGAGCSTLRLQTRIELVENHAAFAAIGFCKVSETAHPGYDRPTSITMQKPVDPDADPIDPDRRPKQQDISP